jgi:hypothetical protein
MTRISLLMAILLNSPAMAGEIPTEAEKIAALKLAYELNGQSMVRWGSIDLSGPLPKKDREILPPQKERFKGK